MSAHPVLYQAEYIEQPSRLSAQGVFAPPSQSAPAPAAPGRFAPPSEQPDGLDG